MKLMIFAILATAFLSGKHTVMVIVVFVITIVRYAGATFRDVMLHA